VNDATSVVSSWMDMRSKITAIQEVENRRKKRMKAMKIVLAALAALMVLGGLGMATTSTADITITANVGEGIGITTPGSFAWNLAVGSNDKAAGNLVVDSNIPSTAGEPTLEVSVADTGSAPNVGYFYDGTNKLASALQINHDSGAYSPLTSSFTIAATATTPGTHTYAIGFKQEVAYNDVVSSNYQKTLRFTVDTSA